VGEVYSDIEQPPPLAHGFLYEGSGLLRPAGGLAAGVEHQIDREIGLGHRAP
jgi:hypothetical protein